MKKIIFVIAFILGAIISNAQSTTPRFGPPPQDNTGRQLTYKYAALTDAAGADSVTLNPNCFENIYNITLVDSFTLKQPAITGAYYGDIIKLYISAASGTPFLKFTGSNWLTQGKATITTNKVGTITLFFNGSKWVESGRLLY